KADQRRFLVRGAASRWREPADAALYSLFRGFHDDAYHWNGIVCCFVYGGVVVFIPLPALFHQLERQRHGGYPAAFVGQRQTAGDVLGPRDLLQPWPDSADRGSGPDLPDVDGAKAAGEKQAA